MSIKLTQDPSDPDLRSGPCERCGTVLHRWRGDPDIECDVCGAQYNASGQRLRDDWRSNPSNYDDDISDLDGFELAALARERFDP